jgi:hypothetical protein
MRTGSRPVRSRAVTRLVRSRPLPLKPIFLRSPGPRIAVAPRPARSQQDRLWLMRSRHEGSRLDLLDAGARPRRCRLQLAGGAILRAVFDGETGQLQESGRDPEHAQLGIGLLATLCEIAWNQGDDLYGYADNRLLRGFEYTASYLLGNDAPFETYTDPYRTFTRMSSEFTAEQIASSRAHPRPIYEMVWNHYLDRRASPHRSRDGSPRRSDPRGTTPITSASGPSCSCARTRGIAGRAPHCTKPRTDFKCLTRAAAAGSPRLQRGRRWP